MRIAEEKKPQYFLF